MPRDIEPSRAAALAAYHVLDTLPEPEFDDIVTIAATLCAAPVALVSLLDGDRQWFKARTGFSLPETPIAQSICAHAVKQREPTMIRDLALDPRTRDNALVTGQGGLRFYAAAPLAMADGTVLGTVCVMDHVPRPGGLLAAQLHGLEALARQVVRLLEARTTLHRREHDMLEQARRGDDQRERDRSSRSATEAGNVGTFELTTATGAMTVSPELCRIYGLPETVDLPAGTIEALVVAEDAGLASNAAGRLDGSAELNVVYRIRRADDGQVRWISRRAQFRAGLRGEGGPTKMFGTVQDVTEQQLATLRVSALVDLGDLLRDAQSIAEVTDLASRLVGRTLAVARAGYAAIELATDSFTVESDWTAPGVASLVGRHTLLPFPVTIARLGGGETVVEPDIAATSWPVEERSAYAALGVRSQVKVPLVVKGRLEAVLFLHDPMPRQWSNEELEFVRGVADRTYASVAKLHAEARQQMLNLEIAHRLKNTMSMVQAIAGQTLRSVADRNAIELFERRLQALGKAHDVLMRSDWTAADMTALVREVLRTVGQESRCSVVGPAVELGSRAALSLSLVVHELATNAAKYGALSAEAGHVRIVWQVNEEGGEAMLNFTWQESGGPPAAVPARKGFGSRLIQAGLVGTGGVTLRYDDAGFKAEMQASLALVAQA